MTIAVSRIAGRALRRGLALHRARHRGRRVGDDLVRDLVGDLNGCAQVGVVDQHGGGVGHDRHPLDELLLQVLALWRTDPEHLAHAEQRRRLGAGHRIHRHTQLGVGQLTAEVHQQLLNHHLTPGADSPAQTERLGADAFVVDPDRAVDRVLGGQQDRRVRLHSVAQPDAVRRDLVHQRLAGARHRGDALADIRRDVGIGQPSLQFLPAGVELGQRRLGVTAGRTRQHCAVERGHVALDRGHHFGAVGGAPQIGRLRRARVDAQTAERARQNQRHQNDREHFPADRPIRDRPSGRSLGRWLRLWFEIDERAVSLLQLRERGHRRPPSLSAAGPQFTNGASFIRLPADFALG